MITMLLSNRLYLAPIDPTNVRNVLDLGCGTGIWAMDFADAHPGAEVTGVDLSPIQPPWVPPNCKFEIDDIEDEWTFQKNQFDFIHIRCLMGSINDWTKLYAQAYDHLAPGGWIQHLDMDIGFTSDDGTVGEDHVMAEWSRTFFDAGDKMGKTFRVLDQMAPLMQNAGFTDLYQAVFKVPVGGWTKDKIMKQIGQWNYYYCLQGCEGWALFLLTKVMQWQMEEVQVFIAKFKNALNDRRNHAYYKM
jgi:trans-aconitate methyltransferase